jgi:tRNA-specific 2-thiouridylase
MARVLVAMSGGVDSAVAAELLSDQGHDVTGVHLRLADVPDAEQVPGHGCCGIDDAQDARRTAQVLDIPFYVWDMTDIFAREVQDPFSAEYAAGRTPNPCVMCNERVKYTALLERALDVGFDAIATGHHARLERDGRPAVQPGPGSRLMRARDAAKDQSYVLHMATPAQLAATLLPVGELMKEEVRDRARAAGLRVAGKPDSYDVCFIPDGDTAGWLAGQLGERPGPIVDVDGATIGEHRGVWSVTVGQRRGLGLDHHERRFVVDVDAEQDTITVGPRSALECRWVEVAAPTWTVEEAVDVGAHVRVQLRAHGATLAARTVVAEGGVLRLELDEPAHGIALGQAAVVYDAADRHCLGGGRITRADRPSRLPMLDGAMSGSAAGGVRREER